MSRTLTPSHAVPGALVVVCLALAASACGPRPSSRSPGAGAGGRDAQELAEAVERLRLERRQRERKIRDLEHQLAARGSSPVAGGERGPTAVPSLPVQVLAPPPGAAERAEPSLHDSSGLGRDAESELPGELTSQGERVIGVADDGSEIVYIEDAATGRVVAPSAEILAEVSRARSRAAAPAAARPGLDGPDIEEGEARSLLDEAAGERLPPAPVPLASLGRRAARTRAVPPRPAVTAPAPGSSRPSSPSLPTVRGSDGGAAETHYRAAIALVRRAEYPAAIASLREFLERHPRHDYADNAQYWLGEAFYAQHQYDQALAELRRVVELYPQGNKVPDALLKVGYCHLAMGDRDKSTAVLRDLIRLFPRSNPALLAVKKLEETSR